MLVVKTEIFSRVSGYFRPVSNWNNGKREEFSERKFANVEDLNGMFNSDSSDNSGRVVVP